jgi:uncharacterized membrane protein YhhN
VNSAQRWWRGLDHYYWLTAFLAARGIQKSTCRLVAVVIFGLSAISITLIWSPTGPHGTRNEILAVVVAVCCWAMSALWLRSRWPTAFQSRLCVCVGSVCVAVSCLIQSDGVHPGIDIRRGFPHHPMAGHHLDRRRCDAGGAGD